MFRRQHPCLFPWPSELLPLANLTSTPTKNATSFLFPPPLLDFPAVANIILRMLQMLCHRLRTGGMLLFILIPSAIVFTSFSRSAEWSPATTSKSIPLFAHIIIYICDSSFCCAPVFINWNLRVTGTVTLVVSCPNNSIFC